MQIYCACRSFFLFLTLITLRMKLILLKCCLFNIVLFCFIEVHGADNILSGKNNQALKILPECRFSYGFIFKHTYKMAHLITGHIPAVNVRMGFPTNASKNWHKAYKNPVYGAGFFYADLNNHALGDAAGLYYFFNVPFTRKNTFSLNYNMAAGLGYLTRRFSIEDNYYNAAMSTHLNVYLNLSLDMKMKIFRQLDAAGSIGITHFSNGIIKVPNLGINIISAEAGLRYRFGDPALPEKQQRLPKPAKRYRYSLIFGNFYKDDEPPDDTYFYTSSLCFNIERNLSLKHTLGAGADLFFDGALKHKFVSSDKEFSGHQYFRFGLHAAYDAVFGKVAFTMQQGIYLYNPWKPEGRFYNRFGLKYRFASHWLVNVTLKTHAAVADAVEIGGGYWW